MVARTHRIFQIGQTNVHFVGTAHLSTESYEEVKRIIEETKPYAVCVELCWARREMLFMRPSNRSKPMSLIQLLTVLRKQAAAGKNLFSVLYPYAAAMLADELGGIIPGMEFAVAARTANKLKPKAFVELIDRPVDATIARSWGALSFFKKLQDLKNLIEKMKDTESDLVTQAFEELIEQFPVFAHALIHERDEYLTARTMAVCRALESQNFYENPSRNCVAVVGAGHLNGIERLWPEFEKKTREELNERMRELQAHPPGGWSPSRATRIAMILGALGISAGVFAGSVLLLCKGVRWGARTAIGFAARSSSSSTDEGPAGDRRGGLG